MKLGIMINTDRHAREIAALTKAAVSRGHEVILFMTDSGVRLLKEPSVVKLHEIKGVTCSFCQHSAETAGVPSDSVPKGIVCGSQYDNALMNEDADRVIVL